jgi:hypothetical protein
MSRDPTAPTTRHVQLFISPGPSESFAATHTVDGCGRKLEAELSGHLRNLPATSSRMDHSRLRAPRRVPKPRGLILAFLGNRKASLQ